MKINTDIDIDCPTSFDPSKIFGGVVKASMYKDKKLTPHPCGVYFQKVPTDPLTGLSAVPYAEAEELGCFKLDFLHLHVYDHFSSRDEITELLKHEPDWDLLKIPSVVEQLFQASKHFDLLQQVKPRSILTIGDCLALIRPQKRFILKYYVENPAKYRPELYKQDAVGGYGFKKAHAIAYALVIVLQLHLIKGGIKFN
jgi:DNA polymerase III alpha subunit